MASGVLVFAASGAVAVVSVFLDALEPCILRLMPFASSMVLSDASVTLMALTSLVASFLRPLNVFERLFTALLNSVTFSMTVVSAVRLSVSSVLSAASWMCTPLTAASRA